MLNISAESEGQVAAALQYADSAGAVGIRINGNYVGN